MRDPGLRISHFGLRISHLGAASILSMGAWLVPAPGSAQSADTGVSRDDATFLGGGQPAGGQERPPGQPPETGAAAWLAGEEAAAQPAVAPPAEDPYASLVEDPETAYHQIGVRAHAIFLPSWLIKGMGELAEFPGVIGAAAGLEYAFRRRGIDIVPAIWWAEYFTEGFTREESDPLSETEHLDVSLHVLWFTVDFLPSYDVNEWFAIEYGGGIGLGIRFGDIIRNEAYRDPSGGWHPCNGPGNPIVVAPDAQLYCEASGGHYDTPVEEKLRGLWPVYPTLQGKFGLRFKPLRNLIIHTDFGIGLPSSLFSIGGRINYMF